MYKPAAALLISSADGGLGRDNLAAAKAVADTLLLAASSEAASTGTSAAATSTFLGNFTTGAGGLGWFVSRV